MKNNFYVYEIKEKTTDKVVYVGQTTQPSIRYLTHFAPSGKFDRNLHYMNILENEWIFNNKKDARKYEDILQEYYGFETELQKRRKRIVDLLSPKNKRGGKKRAQDAFKKQCIELECPHCHEKGIGRIMYRWHFHKCKYK